MLCNNNFDTSGRSNVSDLSSNDTSTSSQQSTINLIVNKLGKRELYLKTQLVFRNFFSFQFN